MDINDLKNKFVQLWGTVGVDWGINKTMAQIHGLLLVSEEALTTDEIMASLQISRGNANMNLRDLLSWELIYREHLKGDRKDYFYAEKDIWEASKKIVNERSRRELQPMMRVLNQLLVDIDTSTASISEKKAFKKILSDVNGVGKKFELMMHTFLKLDHSVFFKTIFKLFKGKRS